MRTCGTGGGGGQDTATGTLSVVAQAAVSSVEASKIRLRFDVLGIGFLLVLFGCGYGLARIVSEFFREPDPQLGYLMGGATMGMLLSIPLVLLGLLMIWSALKQRTHA